MLNVILVSHRYTSPSKASSRWSWSWCWSFLSINVHMNKVAFVDYDGPLSFSNVSQSANIPSSTIFQCNAWSINTFDSAWRSVSSLTFINMTWMFDSYQVSRFDVGNSNTSFLVMVFFCISVVCSQ